MPDVTAYDGLVESILGAVTGCSVSARSAVVETMGMHDVDMTRDVVFETVRDSVRAAGQFPEGALDAIRRVMREQ